MKVLEIDVPVLCNSYVHKDRFNYKLYIFLKADIFDIHKKILHIIHLSAV